MPQMGQEKIDFFETFERQHKTITFDDVDMKNDKMSDVPANEIEISSKFSRRVELKVPIVSSPMDTVTESAMSIAMAKLGGLGIIHAALSKEAQAKEVRKVKWHLNGLIRTPIFVRSEQTVEAVEQMREKRDFQFHSFPVVDNKNKLVGLYARRDFEYCEDVSEEVSQHMTPLEKVVTGKAGIDPDEAYILMRDNDKLSSLPLINDDGTLAGLYIKSDVLRSIRGNPLNYNLDSDGRLRVGIAVSTDIDNALERIDAAKGYFDVVVIDTARGNSAFIRPSLRAIKDAITNLKRENFEVDVVAGNISHGVPAKALMEAGADGLRVGQGGGSICTTRINTGAGTPQLSAVYRCFRGTGGEIPICSDGGISKPGDIAKALAAGANSVMMGRGLAATKETPIKPHFENGELVVGLRGMGSEDAMRDNGSARYSSSAPEGVSTTLTYRGSVVDIMEKYIKYLRAGLEYVGAPNIEQHRLYTNFDVREGAGRIEAGPHDI